MSTKVFVGNLNFATTREELEGLFSQVGQVVEVFLPTDRATGRPRGFAFVEFSSSEQAAEAISRFNDHELGGRKLRLDEAAERRPRPAYSVGPPSFGGGGGGSGGGFGGGGGGGGPRPSKPKGSRRNIRGKKRSL